MRKIQWADLIILHFPVYWFSMPAILKGWIDRVLVSGLCYGGMRFYDRGGLRGKKAMLAVTIGSKRHMLATDGIHGDLADMLAPILRGTLAYTGMTVLPPFVAYHFPYLEHGQREQILDPFRPHLRQLDDLEPLQFPSLDDFDADLYLKTGA